MANPDSLLTQKEAQTLVPLETDIVSGHLFFCRRIELPEGLEESELAGVIELELDKLSPFPVEHLHFGYLVDSASKFAWVYASYKKRIENERVRGWEHIDWATTDFAIGLLANADSKKPLIIGTPDSLVCLQFDDQSELPCRFTAKIRDNSEDASLLNNQISEFARELGLSDGLRSWEVISQINQTGQELVLEANDLDSNDRILRRLPRSRSWNMDVRDSDVIVKAQAENRRNFILWRVVMGMAALIALLIVGEFTWGLALSYKNMRTQWNEADEPQVEEILSMQATVRELQNFKESDLLPFKMLSATIPYMDRNTLFSQVETDDPNILIIEGEQNSISERNAFKARLEGSQVIEGVEILNSRNTQRGTEFTFLVGFKEGEIIND